MIKSFEKVAMNRMADKARGLSDSLSKIKKPSLWKPTLGQGLALGAVGAGVGYRQIKKDSAKKES
jgi:hypothetical protein